MKLISVITVVFNDVNNISKTIESVLLQNIPPSDLEYIIIDGGSTDGTVEKIKEYKEKIAIFISEKDTGIYNAMNKALKYVTGKWCLFLNSGDVLEHEAFKALNVETCVADDVAIIYGNTIRSFQHGHRMRHRMTFKEGELPPVCHQSAFIKAEVMRKFGYNERYRICADLDLFKKIFDSHYKFYYVDRDIAIYDMNGFSAHNMTAFAREKREIGFKVSSLDMVKFYLKSCLFRLSPKLYSCLFYNSIKRQTRKEDILY